MSAPATCRQIAADVQQHRRTAREAVEEALAAAERFQDRYRPFIRILAERARRQAEQVDGWVGQGRRLPLAGVPFAVKDLIDAEGTPTTCGSPAFTELAAADAHAVRKLTAAGAVLIGKANLHECAFGFTGENPHFGDCRNPWNPERIAGGSSSGSAVAVALGICPLALGSDTGGSIRQPAALCGITGLKPSYGRVSRAGVAPLSWTMDHIGPLTRDAADAALVAQVLAGADPDDETTQCQPPANFVGELQQSPAGLRAGVPRSWFYDDLPPDVAQAVAATLDSLKSQGLKLIDVELPYLPETVGAHRAIIFPEAASYHRPWLSKSPEKYGADILPLLQAGLFFPAVDYLQGQRMRRKIRAAWAETFREVDLLVTPAAPITATRFGQQEAELPSGPKPLVRAYLDYTLPFNLSGHPALSTPCGFDSQGLPIGLQLVGRPWGEGTILRTAHALQEANRWHERLPPPLREAR